MRLTRRLPAGAAVAGLGGAAVVGISGELSAGALVAVLVAGVAVSAGVLARRAGEGGKPVGRRGLPWLGWLVVAAAWEAGCLAADGVPTLSDLMDPVLAHPVPRGLATLVWLGAGGWLLTRPCRDPEPR